MILNNRTGYAHSQLDSVKDHCHGLEAKYVTSTSKYKKKKKM